jgi:hypothetical protein
MRMGDQANPFVVAKRVGRNAGRVGQLSNAHDADDPLNPGVDSNVKGFVPNSSARRPYTETVKIAAQILSGFAVVILMGDAVWCSDGCPEEGGSAAVVSTCVACHRSISVEPLISPPVTFTFIVQPPAPPRIVLLSGWQRRLEHPPRVS